MRSSETKIYPMFFACVAVAVATSIYWNIQKGSATVAQSTVNNSSGLETGPLASSTDASLASASIQQDPPQLKQPTVTFSDQDYQSHIDALAKALSGEDFTIVLQKPFVVIGNERPEVVRQRAQQTVKWAVDRLKSQYFTKDPNKIINIWLMKDEASYEKQCLAVVKYKPTTPFGFYSSKHSVLMMNISTGGGTLVHEIVHPFIESNFPECPSWFNEGLASLYEQSSANEDNKIIGLTNWRLRGLQLAIKDDKVPSFKTLCSTTTTQFYREDPGTNYSQARYLCYYLQQKGKLQQFYKSFVANCTEDKTGYQTLAQVLETDDMAAFKSVWQNYVMTLRFP